jgi:hypothetical protein
MSWTAPEHRIRAFRITVRASATGFGITLEETNGHPKNTTTVANATDKHTFAVLPSVMAAVKTSGHARTILGAQRKAPIVLTDEAGVRLALTLVATAPVTKARRVGTMLDGIDTMAIEEAYYWYAKCMGPDGVRVRRALRLFLSEE